MTTIALRRLLALALLPAFCLPALAAPPPTPSTRPSLEALPGLLTAAQASDPDQRLRARREAKALARAYLRAHAPAGMRLVPGRFVFAADRLRMEGGYYLAVHEVRVDAFVAFQRSRGGETSRWEKQVAAHPVVHVTHSEASAYARAQQCRLPTVAELQNAATSCGRFPYPWGRTFDAGRANSREGAHGGTEPVAARPTSASLQGIVALRGNVAEWAADTPDNADRKRRFLACGGSFRRQAARARFVSYRLRAGDHRDDVGFRLARDLPPLAPQPAPKKSAPGGTG